MVRFRVLLAAHTQLRKRQRFQAPRRNTLSTLRSLFLFFELHPSLDEFVEVSIVQVGDEQRSVVNTLIEVFDYELCDGLTDLRPQVQMVFRVSVRALLA